MPECGAQAGVDALCALLLDRSKNNLKATEPDNTNHDSANHDSANHGLLSVNQDIAIAPFTEKSSFVDSYGCEGTEKGQKLAKGIRVRVGYGRNISSTALSFSVRWRSMRSWVKAPDLCRMRPRSAAHSAMSRNWIDAWLMPNTAKRR